MFRTAILTISDSCFTGERTDKSGPLIEESLPPDAYTIVERKILPDDLEVIKGALLHIIGKGNVELVLTTGGTGFSPRDVTPEATDMVVQKRTPGIDFALFSNGVKTTPFAVLSRAHSGIRDQTLIVNLPGNPKAVRSGINALLPVLPHALSLIIGESSDGDHEFE